MPKYQTSILFFAESKSVLVLIHCIKYIIFNHLARGHILKKVVLFLTEDVKYTLK